MQETISFFRNFIVADFDRKSYTIIALVLSIFIAFNYSIDFEDSYLDINSNPIQGWLKYFLFYSVFSLFIIISMKNNKAVKEAIQQPAFYIILAVFFGMLFLEKNLQAFNLQQLTPNYYFNYKIANQLNGLLFFALELVVLGHLFGRFRQKGFGLWNFHSKIKIYLVFIAIILPIIYLASIQADFLNSYPKLKVRYFIKEEYLNYFFAYEPFYLLNFIRIEWLFRGFLVLALYPFLGKRVVILMASVYCIFHFGKPLVECISSFFGGYILGMISYQTKSIWGGVVIHVGIALCMDLFSLIHYL